MLSKFTSSTSLSHPIDSASLFVIHFEYYYGSVKLEVDILGKRRAGLLGGTVADVYVHCLSAHHGLITGCLTWTDLERDGSSWIFVLTGVAIFWVVLELAIMSPQIYILIAYFDVTERCGPKQLRFVSVFVYILFIPVMFQYHIIHNFCRNRVFRAKNYSNSVQLFCWERVELSLCLASRFHWETKVLLTRGCASLNPLP